MSLQQWLKNAWLRPHRPSAEEVAALLEVIERDLVTSSDARLNADWRFAIAYNAALQSAALALKASGYDTPKGSNSHERTIDSLAFTIEADKRLIETLQAYRSKRGGGVYEKVGIASDAEIEELVALAVGLRDDVLTWLKEHHPGFLSKKRTR